MKSKKPAAFGLSMLVAGLLLTGCAGQLSAPPPPDTRLLEPAQQSIAEAEAAGAASLAPEALREAWRRLTIAQDLMLTRRTAGGELPAAAREQVQRLVAQSSLAGRVALARTRERAVASKLGELREPAAVGDDNNGERN